MAKEEPRLEASSQSSIVSQLSKKNPCQFRQEIPGNAEKLSLRRGHTASCDDGKILESSIIQGVSGSFQDLSTFFPGKQKRFPYGLTDISRDDQAMHRNYKQVGIPVVP